ncbi:MAG: hypothetical protein QOJ79_336 [Actinomycetota bacterium]|jgi:hypothetical protein|nr:hypothetical protein [Actinomycetota bacterium]
MTTFGRHKLEIPAPRAASVVPLAPVVSGPEADDLQTLYNRYRALSSKLAPDLVETPEMALARAALTRALLEDGWRAPEIVHDRLRADEDVIRPRLVAAS